MQASKAPLKAQHQSVHLGSWVCWLFEGDRCYFVPGGMGAFCGGKKTKQLWYTWVFEGSTLFASPQAVILSELKLSRGKPGLVIAHENPQTGEKKKARHWNKQCGWLSTRHSSFQVRANQFLSTAGYGAALLEVLYGRWDIKLQPWLLLVIKDFLALLARAEIVNPMSWLHSSLGDYIFLIFFCTFLL